MRISKWLIPNFDRASWGFVLKSALVCGAIFGVYGSLQDQITYSISTEYFTLLKFDQFAWANPGTDNPRWFVALIGFIAAGGGGFISGWVLARIALAGKSAISVREIVRLFGLCPVLAFIFAPLGLLMSLGHIPESWVYWMQETGVTDTQSFAQVGMIHNFGYLGGMTGLVIAAVLLKRRFKTNSQQV